MIKWIGRIALFVCGLALWCAGVRIAQSTTQATGTIAVRFETEGVSPADLARIERYVYEDGGDTHTSTLWHEQSEEKLSVENYKITIAKVIEIFGRVEDVIYREMLSGVLPENDGDLSCVISERTAFDLWGSTGVLNRTVYWDGNTYNVTGIIAGDDRLMIVRVNAGCTETFYNMSLSITNGGGRDEAETYLRRLGFEGAILLDLPVLGYFLRLMAYLPAMLIGILILLKLILYGSKFLRFPALMSVYSVPAIFGLCACIWIFHEVESFPSQLLPNAWSDFGYFGGLIKGFAYNIKTWLSNPSPADLDIFAGTVAVIILILMSLVLLAVFACNVKICSLRSLITMILLIYFASVFFSRSGSLEVNNRIRLATFLWVIVSFGLNVFNKYLYHEDKEAVNA